MSIFPRKMKPRQSNQQLCEWLLSRMNQGMSADEIIPPRER